MLLYMQTTTLILLMCGVFAVFEAIGLYFYFSSRSGRSQVLQKPGTIVPTLVVAPVLIFGFYKLFAINLLFPVHYLASWDVILLSAVVPALVLVVASGLGKSVWLNIAIEYEVWVNKTFFLVSKSYGISKHRSLGRLVVIKSIGQALAQSLPWLFGELIVVEAIFNAPGLALDAWHKARMRDIPALIENIVWLVGIYLVFIFAISYLSRWVGRKLESYS